MNTGFGTTLVHLLVKDKVINQEAMNKAQEIREQKGGKVEDILVEQGFISPDDMLSYRAMALETVPIHLDALTIPEEIANIIPEDIASSHKIIPIAKTSKTLTLAMLNPLDINAIDDIEKLTGLHVVPVISIRDSIERAIKRSYRSSRETVDEYLKNIKEPQTTYSLETVATEIDQESYDRASLERLAQGAPVVGLVDLILRQAIEERVSDIHIEPYRERSRVRLRFDGILEETHPLPKKLHPAVVSRIKIMSKMDIAERRQPQDGRITLKVAKGNINMRVSSLPTAYGEKVVIRVADESKTALGLEQLGMPRIELEKYLKVVESPYGMILVTGPTGSGKTSTLYASLHHINKPMVNIITIEDPIEYLIEGLNQVEINVKAGRTFPSVLRSILRQDPDIIMVGEIRDFETAELAVEAALTGHLVFSTLHTNDAPSAISRLLDLKVEPFLISAALTCVIAQRLVRVLCKSCKKPYKPSQTILDELNLPPGDYTFYEKQGCSVCNNKGYRGRTGLYEIMFMNKEIRELTSTLKDVKDIQIAAIKDGMKTLRRAAIDKVIDGITSLEEAFRATADL